jgi:hypothetical protein
MDDDGELREQILHIEAHIEELADVIEGCRKIIVISKVAIAAGGTLILAITLGAVRFDPTVMIGALAAVILSHTLAGDCISKASRAAPQRASFRTKSSWRVDYLQTG